ncbi:MAG: amidohydrolase family protein [Proteobacteria bacterium]|nr:amidohydrolase family protein [Pseudomonadota bacterium]
MSASHRPTAFGRITPPRQDWLDRAPREDVIEPALPIIDTHHHVWETPERGRYMLEELHADLGSGHNVIQTVFIDCHYAYRTSGPKEMQAVGEVETVAKLAAESDRRFPGKAKVAAGIVGNADLTLGDKVEPVLAAMIEAGQGRFRGVRNSAGWHEDPVIGNNHQGAGRGHYARADFRQGLKRLAKMGLSLDGLVYHSQHAEMLDLARAVPEANIIMNHTGMPLGYGPYTGKLDEVAKEWRRHLPEIAKCPNVSMKLGGVMMRLAAYDYNALPAPPSSEELARHWRPWIEPCIEIFGASRCQFESNFPVDKMGIGYKALYNAFKRIASGCSASEKADLFAGTARRAYRLP